MPKSTPNIGLTTWTPTVDSFSLKEFNSNMDKIDTDIKNQVGRSPSFIPSQFGKVFASASGSGKSVIGNQNHIHVWGRRVTFELWVSVKKLTLDSGYSSGPVIAKVASKYRPAAQVPWRSITAPSGTGVSGTPFYGMGLITPEGDIQLWSMIGPATVYPKVIDDGRPVCIYASYHTGD